MANFGFTQLTVVAPYEQHWREAKSAIGADALLRNAKVAATLAEAVAHCTLVVGTGTLAHRTPEQPVVALPQLYSLLQPAIEADGRIGLVFGPEKRGLTREDLSRCHLLAEIPTDARQPSMNLGQAVAVCLYEVAIRDFPPFRLARDEGPNGKAVAGAELDRLAGVIDGMMVAAGYSPGNMEKANLQGVRLLLRRLTLTQSDARRILGLFRRVLRRLEH